MSKMKLTITGQVHRVKTLIADFSTALMNNVHELECPTPRTAPDKIKDGADPATSLKGYAYLIQSHQLRHYDTLSADEFLLLERQSNLLLQLAKNSESLNKYFHGEEVLAKLARQTRTSLKDLSPSLSSYVTTLYDQLKSAGEVSMISGTPAIGTQQGHFTLIKLTAQQSEIHATTYNAGFEANQSPSAPHLVMGIERKKLGDTTEATIKNFICLHAEKRHTAAQTEYARIKSAIATILGEPVSHTDVAPQHKGNCTTRSVREWLKDSLPPALFDPIYELASSRTSDEHATLLLLHSRHLEEKLEQQQSKLAPLRNQQLCASPAKQANDPAADKKRKTPASEEKEIGEVKRAKKADPAPTPAPSRYPRLKITLPPKKLSFSARELTMSDMHHGRG